MKKVILGTCVLALAASAVAAIGPQYDANNFEALPVEVNTTSNEFGMSAYRENSVVYFRADSSSKKDGLDNVTILKSNVLPSGELSQPEVCTELQNLGVCGSFAYDKNADRIYFSKFNKNTKSYQLYESTYAGDAWMDPQPVEIKGFSYGRMNMSIIENANWDYIDKGASIVQPVLANNGKRLYFVSDAKQGSRGKTDIWYMDREDDAWGTPVNLGDSINTKGNEQYPFILGDSILYYASTKGSDNDGGYDLYAARLTDNGVQPVETEKMNDLFNTGKNDYNFINVNDNVYFISEREDGQKEDIIGLVGLAKPEEIVIAAVEPAPAPVSEVEPPFHHVLFYFDFDKSSMKADTDPDVQALLAEMRMFPDRRFEIIGHTDERGSDAYNDRLAIRRANTVRDVLVKNGIDKNMLVVKGCGERQPVVKNAQKDEEHAMNRRVEVNFYSEK
ncbi:MAG: OmpA family protein [Bacteroidales bacterium]|nr:OmpA family protein [Bacteroidales bacterium]